MNQPYHMDMEIKIKSLNRNSKPHKPCKYAVCGVFLGSMSSVGVGFFKSRSIIAFKGIFMFTVFKGYF